MKGEFGCKVRGGGALDIDVAQHVVADVAAHVELFHASVPEHKGSEALACTAALQSVLVSPSINSNKMLGRHRAAVREHSRFNIVVHVQVKIVEVLLQLLLVFAEPSQIVHLLGGKI